MIISTRKHHEHDLPILCRILETLNLDLPSLLYLPSQARKNRLQLVDDLRLHRRIIHRRLIPCIPGANCNITTCSPEQDHIRLPRQPRAPAPIRVPAAQQARINPREDILEVTRLIALCLRDSWEIDVQPRIIWQVRLSRVDNGSCHIQRQVRIHFTPQRRRRVPRRRITRLA